MHVRGAMRDSAPIYLFFSFYRDIEGTSPSAFNHCIGPLTRNMRLSRLEDYQAAAWTPNTPESAHSVNPVIHTNTHHGVWAECMHTGFVTGEVGMDTSTI